MCPWSCNICMFISCIWYICVNNDWFWLHISRRSYFSVADKIWNYQQESNAAKYSEGTKHLFPPTVNGSLFIKNSTLTVKENKTIEIVCEALGWAPAPDITWMTNDSFIDKSRYVTQHSQGSNGLHNALSILTLTPTDTEILTCLADIGALPNPQNATVTVIFVNSTLGKWIFVVLCLFCSTCTVLPILRTVIFVLFCFYFEKSFTCKWNTMRRAKVIKLRPSSYNLIHR